MNKPFTLKLVLKGSIILLLLFLIFLLCKWFVLSNSIHKIPVTIQQEKLINPSSPIKVNQGDEVVLRITTDEENEIHVEGYHAFSKITPDKKTDVYLHALTPGKFPLQLMKSGNYIGILEVKARK